jgi:hypothetical protein
MTVNHLIYRWSRFEIWDRIQHGTVKPFRRAIIFILTVLLLQIFTACGKRVIMSANYENEPIATYPAEQPVPSPPQDAFYWGKVEVISRVVGYNGSKQVLVVPSENYSSTFKYRALVLNAYTDVITPDKRPGIRGNMTVTLFGYNTMVISLNSFYANRPYYPLGGFIVSSGFKPNIGTMSDFDLRVKDMNNYIINSTGLCDIKNGEPVTLSWAIDQQDRIISLVASPSEDIQYKASVHYEPDGTVGVTGNPEIQKIWIMIEFFEAQRDAEVFFDDFWGQEY